MQQPREPQPLQPAIGPSLPQGLTRREIMAGGSLALGSLLLTACGGGSKAYSSAPLPGPYWAEPAATNSFKPTHAVAPLASSVPAPIPAAVPSTDWQTPPGVIPRSQWTRFSISNSVEHFPMNGVRRITVHHDGMPPTSLATAGQVASRIEQIRQSHVVGRGWADLGYHYVIDPSGRIWEGRSIRWQGAHVKDQNENNLGILVMGNFEVQSPTQAALASLDRFLANQMQRYGVAIGNVRTHRERAPTECPGRNLQGYMVRTRSSAGPLYAMARTVGLARG